VKKKLAALDMRVQLAGAVLVVALVGIAGFMLVVSPKGLEAGKIQRQADAEQSQVYHRRAELRAGLHPPAIQTADLFRLARAMPDHEDMPGIILTLSDVARSAGIKFDLIEPSTNGSTSGPTGSFQAQRIHLQFNGDFYGLSDFLYRLRSLVSVRNGVLQTSGRLFNVDTVTFNVQANSFPQISADLSVEAYMYAPPAAAAPTGSAAPPTGAPASTTPTSTDPTALPASGASAAGATP
jgi:Tfp pilus assembly protein PilO